jgi:hypothetical protein
MYRVKPDEARKNGKYGLLLLLRVLNRLKKVSTLLKKSTS